MTKQYLEALAKEIKAAYMLDRNWNEIPEETQNAALVAINIVIEVSVASNDRFDSRRFRAACGVPV